ncbi:dsaVM [Symbiodinium necroappetens]|uniref:Cytosine-specific methyltransferase n=1 Tax=Symbiodinium necroappetens TaxID=1628268 RepID=A0A812Z045_9DINO|nr:dsaVM [Symbiodinium necroappetens]
MRPKAVCLLLVAIWQGRWSWLGPLRSTDRPQAQARVPASRACLVVPAQLVETAYGELSDANCLPRRWHPEGRYGIPIQVAEDSQQRLIPLLTDDVHRLPPSLRAALMAGTVHMRAQEIPWKGRQAPAKQRLRPSPSLARELSLSAPGGRGKAVNFTFAELFAGIGGFRLGLERLGGNCVFASEIEPYTRDMYLHNFGNAPAVAGDIQEVDASAIPPHDILVAGFPCQPFSALGTQPAFDDDRGLLFREILRILEASQPNFFLLENVPGLLRCDDGRVLETIKAELSQAGYDVLVETVNAKALTAQARKRVFIIGFRTESQLAHKFQLPNIPDLCLRAEDILETEDEVMRSGLLEDYTLTDEQFVRLQGSAKWARRGGMSSTLAWGDKVCATLVGHYGKTLRKGNSQLVPRNAPFKPRRFTARECARLMGFPNSFKLTEQEEGQSPGMWYRALYKMFGNSVSPPVVAVLGGAILASEQSSDALRDLGISAALGLALEAITPRRRQLLECRLGVSKLYSVPRITAAEHLTECLFLGSLRLQHGFIPCCRSCGCFFCCCFVCVCVFCFCLSTAAADAPVLLRGRRCNS